LVYDLNLNYEVKELKDDNYLTMTFIHPTFKIFIIDEDVGEVFAAADVLPNTGS
jgi:hypothetical protein